MVNRCETIPNRWRWRATVAVIAALANVLVVGGVTLAIFLLAPFGFFVAWLVVQLLLSNSVSLYAAEAKEQGWQ